MTMKYLERIIKSTGGVWERYEDDINENYTYVAFTDKKLSCYVDVGEEGINFNIRSVYGDFILKDETILRGEKYTKAQIRNAVRHMRAVQRKIHTKQKGKSGAPDNYNRVKTSRYFGEAV